MFLVRHWHGFTQRFLSLSFFFFSCPFTPGQPRGFSRHVRQIFLVLHRYCLRTDTQKAQKLSQYPRRSSLWSLRDERVEKVFEAKVDKAAVAGSSRGHVSAARTDPSTPDPPDRQHFPSQALLRLPQYWSFFLLHTHNKKKLQECTVRVSAWNPLFYTFYNSIYIRPKASDLRICLLMSRYRLQSFLVLFLYMLSTLYCALRCEKYIGKKIKISTDYAFKCLQNALCREIYLYLFHY